MERRYRVSLNGETSLLMHNDNLEWADKMIEWRRDPANKKISVPGDDRSPAFTWIGNLYIEDGLVVIPSDNLMTMLREGGKQCPTGKGQQTFKALTQSGIIVDQSSWPVLVGGAEIKTERIMALVNESDFKVHEKVAAELGFELFAKRAKIAKSKNVRVRPRFSSWACCGTVTVVDDRITTQALSDILRFAGMYCGLGDWRPSSPMSPGRFGRFTTEVKEV